MSGPAERRTCGIHGDDTTSGRCATCDQARAADRVGWIFTVQGERTQYGHDGTDAMIITVPPRWYAEVEGGRAILARAAGDGLRQASMLGAARVGRVLHHADWQLTDDPATVRRVMPPHCPECAAGTDAAVAYLAEQPGNEVALGLLYFAAAQPPPLAEPPERRVRQGGGG